MTPEEEEAEWDKTRDIDNPLYPWIQVTASLFLLLELPIGYYKGIQELLKKTVTVFKTLGNKQINCTDLNFEVSSL